MTDGIHRRTISRFEEAGSSSGAETVASTFACVDPHYYSLAVTFHWKIALESAPLSMRGVLWCSEDDSHGRPLAVAGISRLSVRFRRRPPPNATTILSHI
jgi:hypothetical protein